MYDREKNRPVPPMFLRWGLFSLAAALLATTALPSFATAARDFQRAGVLVGADDDNQDNPTIQPADAGNQSLDNADILFGGEGPDILVGLLGSDVLQGGTGDDVMIGGPESFVPPNKDVAIGGSGNDLFIWAPGDGSDAFLGGEGDYDAIAFGVIDRDEDGVPLLSESPLRRRTGLPTADTTNLPGFCRLEKVSRAETGFDYLVRFFTRADGVLRVTIRLLDVEQIFCASEAGGEITYANLTSPAPELNELTLDQVRDLNAVVGQIIR